MSPMAAAGAEGCVLGETCDWSTAGLSGLEFGANSGYRVESLLFSTDRLQPGGFSIPRGDPRPNVVFFLRTACRFSYNLIKSTCGRCVILRTTIRLYRNCSEDKNNLRGLRASENKFNGGTKYVSLFDVDASSTKTE